MKLFFDIFEQILRLCINFICRSKISVSTKERELSEILYKYYIAFIIIVTIQFVEIHI